MVGAVAFRQIFRAAHLFEAADGALEFEAAVSMRVQPARLGVRAGKQFHAMLVERVDQGHEPRRLIAHLACHDRDSDEDHGMEALSDG